MSPLSLLLSAVEGKKQRGALDLNAAAGARIGGKEEKGKRGIGSAPYLISQCRAGEKEKGEREQAVLHQAFIASHPTRKKEGEGLGIKTFSQPKRKGRKY